MNKKHSTGATVAANMGAGVRTPITVTGAAVAATGTVVAAGKGAGVRTAGAEQERRGGRDDNGAVVAGEARICEGRGR